MDLRVMAMNEYSIFPKASEHLLEGVVEFYLSAEMQLVYSTVPAD